MSLFRKLGSIPRKESSPLTRFWIMLIGGFVGYYIGYGIILKDYQFIKYTPPERDENGEVKQIPFKVTFKEMSPLELKPELKLRKAQLELELKLKLESNQTLTDS